MPAPRPGSPQLPLRACCPALFWGPQVERLGRSQAKLFLPAAAAATASVGNYRSPAVGRFKGLEGRAPR